MNRTINVMYFKSSGKYYATGEFHSSANEIATDIIDMSQVVNEFKGMRIDGKAPGLSTDGAEFYAVVDSPSGFPCLIFPGV
jgi:hypothetical protein